jgi:hypothetical protein
MAQLRTPIYFDLNLFNLSKNNGTSLLKKFCMRINVRKIRSKNESIYQWQKIKSKLLHKIF